MAIWLHCVTVIQSSGKQSLKEAIGEAVINCIAEIAISSRLLFSVRAWVQIVQKDLFLRGHLQNG